MWFTPEFVGMKVEFPGPNPSTWTLREGISEHANNYGEEQCKGGDYIPEARAVFLCNKDKGDGPEEAVMKVFLQIPFLDTELKPLEQRIAQRGTSESAEYEAEALGMLANVNSSSTPVLLATKTTSQSDTMWIPGGYLGFVLMTKVPGEQITRIADLGLDEREEFRQSFKRGWLECEAGGVIPAGNGIHNLLWDRENKQCYIVDYGRWCPTEEYRRPDPGSGWRDSLFNTWGLRVFAQGGRWKP